MPPLSERGKSEHKTNAKIINNEPLTKWSLRRTRGDSRGDGWLDGGSRRERGNGGVAGDRGDWGGGGSSAGVGRADFAELDVGEEDLGVGLIGLDVLGVSGCDRASATSDTRLVWVGISRVVGVEPEHVGEVVVPDGHNKDVSLCQRLAHLRHATLGAEGIIVIESFADVCAKAFSNGIVGLDSGDFGTGVIDDLSVLNVEAADLDEVAVVLTIVGDKLGDDGHFLAGVDGVGGALAIETAFAEAEGVEITAIGIANGVVTTSGWAVASLASDQAELSAGMRCVRSGDLVGLPNIHLSAASAPIADPCIGVGLGGLPTGNVGLKKRHIDQNERLGRYI